MAAPLAMSTACVPVAEGPSQRGTMRHAEPAILVDPNAQPASATHGEVRVVATLAEAAETVSEARRAGSRERWRILLSPGAHPIARTVAFGADAGPLEIAASSSASDKARTTLIGAIEIAEPQWSAPPEAILARLPVESRDSVRSLVLPNATISMFAGGLSGPVHSGHGVEVDAIHSELFLGNEAMVPARWPNQGLAAIGELIDRGSAPREADPDIPAAERRIEAPRSGRFRPIERERAARWTHATDAWAQGFWNWDWSDEQLPIAAIDADEGIVTLGMPHRYGLAQRGRFFVTNVLEELDAPGEYWIDRAASTVHVWIPDGLVGARVSVSVLGEEMLRFDGTSGVRVVGLEFERTRGIAIRAQGVSGLVVEDCRFRNIGTSALDVEGAEIAVRTCDFAEIGGRGVRLRGGERATLAPSGSEVADSRLIGCGRVLRTYNPAIDLEGVGHRVMRNEIARHPHIAVFLRGNDHLIESNDIHDVVLDTGDAGAVYCGRDWTSHGNIIRGNLFSSIRGTDARFQNAVYLDDMASGFLVESNLFVGCNWGILAGGGRDNTLRGNVFASCGKAISYDARGVGWMAPHIADPATSTLHRNLAAMPIDREPWRSRFPSLGSYLADRFGRPVGSVVQGNILIATPLGRIDDRECVREEGTETSPLEGDAARRFGEELADRARSERVCIESRCLGPVGPSGDPARW